MHISQLDKPRMPQDASEGPKTSGLSSQVGILLRNDKSLSITVSPVAQKSKAMALESAKHISWVQDAPSQERAVAVQCEIHKLLNLVEKDRKTVKEPVLEYGRAIDAAAKTFCAELKEEQVRIAALVGTFQEQENARARAVQQTENERLTALERERAAELAKATTEAQVDKIQEQFNERAAQEAMPAIVPVKAQGQRVTEDWEVTVVNEWLLAKAHPTCVKLTVLLSEVKMLLNNGVKVAGITAKKVTKSTVRTT